MKIVASMLLAAVFGVSLFAQATPKTDQVKPSQSQELLPYLFDNYNAGYGVSASFIGVKVDLLKYSIKIEELGDEWAETVFVDVPRIDDSIKSFGKVEDEAESMSGTIDQHIDLKTGLLKRIETQAEGVFDGKTKAFERLVVFEGDEIRATFLETPENGKTKEVYSFKAKNSEKFYPCMSSTFISYLPLSNNFAETFNCLVDGDTKKGESLVFDKETIKVVGSETITTKAGTFDCYKMTQTGETVGYYDLQGVFKTYNKKDMPKELIGNMLKGIYSHFWIDKRTRKMVKAKFRFKKLFGMDVELEPTTYRNL
jgi:hypothetical protein